MDYQSHICPRRCLESALFGGLPSALQLVCQITLLAAVTGAALLVAGVLVASKPCGVRATTAEREAWLMGTVLRVGVTAWRSATLSGIDSALREVEALEAVISSWRADSESSALNAAAVGATVALSPQFAAGG